MRISQCMIVKNEEKNIRRALTWGKDIFFEQIVVDTGSTDRTVEIAKELGAKIFYFEWIKDFAAAKNYAIERATGDWIAFLDADEYCEPEYAAKIPEIIKCVDEMRDAKTGREADVIASSLTHLNTEGGAVVVQKQYKLFRNRPYIRYSGRIHECVEVTEDRELVEVDMMNELVMLHTGFACEEELKRSKSERNLELLMMEYEECPDCAELELYIAESLESLDREDEVLEFYNKAVKNTDGTLTPERHLMAHQARLYKSFGRKDITEERMLEMYREAMEFNQTWPDFDVALGYFYYMYNRWEDTVKYLEAAVRKIGEMKDFAYSRVMEQWKSICGSLTMSYFNLQDWTGIVKYGTLYLQEDKKEEGVLIPILNRFLNVELEPVTSVMRYIKQLYNLNDRRDRYFLIKCCKQGDFVMLERELKEYLTDEERIKIYGE